MSLKRTQYENSRSNSLPVNKEMMNKMDQLSHTLKSIQNQMIQKPTTFTTQEFELPRPKNPIFQKDKTQRKDAPTKSLSSYDRNQQAQKIFGNASQTRSYFRTGQRVKTDPQSDDFTEQTEKTTITPQSNRSQINPKYVQKLQYDVILYNIQKKKKKILNKYFLKQLPKCPSSRRIDQDQVKNKTADELINGLQKSIFKQNDIKKQNQSKINNKKSLQSQQKPMTKVLSGEILTKLLNKVPQNIKQENMKHNNNRLQQSGVSCYQSLMKLQNSDEKQSVNRDSQQLNKSSSSHQLNQFVTKVTQTPNTLSRGLIQSSSTQLLQQIKYLSRGKYYINIKKKIFRSVDFTFLQRIYYVSSLSEAFQKGEKQNSLTSILYREHFQQSFTALSFFSTLKPVDHLTIQAKKLKQKKLSNLKYQKTIVFDLDETLIHCIDNPNVIADAYVPVTFPTGETVQVNIRKFMLILVKQAGINVRPYVFQVLKELSKLCEVFIFTASHQCYASKVIEYLDPTGELIHGKLFRDSCIQTPEGVHIKNLLVLDRDLKDTVLIDNAAYSYGYQIENGIPIIPFYDNKQDIELIQLLSFIKEDILPAQDVRPIIKQMFQFHKLNEFMTPITAAEKLYSIKI